jgi:outer membrane protein OmpA-like peptidoglycan-associated protein
VGALSLGWAYGNGLRSEVELGYRRNDLNSLSGTVAGSGDASSWRSLINVYYDFKTETPFTPYLGAGIGAARVSLEANPFGASRLHDSDSAFAYQGIAGVGYRLNDRTEVFADYRYFATTSLDFTTAAGTSVDADYGNHTLMVGLRFGFAPPKPAPKEEPRPAVQPAPAPAPAAAPAARAVPRNYLVFFDWDKSDLAPEALRTIATAAEDAKKGNAARIRATGHADRSGPEAYNMRLSMRRAVAVKNELVRLGIAEKEIALVAKGETEPLVPTPDGVREPQNRRVEIVFQ